jgi:hypothetical protein
MSGRTTTRARRIWASAVPGGAVALYERLVGMESLPWSTDSCTAAHVVAALAWPGAPAMKQMPLI